MREVRKKVGVKKSLFAVLGVLFFVQSIPTSGVVAEDMKRWKPVDSNGNVLPGIVVEGLPSVYSTYIIYFDPGGVSPNRCASGCTWILDSYQNVQGTTSTSPSTTACTPIWTHTTRIKINNVR